MSYEAQGYDPNAPTWLTSHINRYGNVSLRLQQESGMDSLYFVIVESWDSEKIRYQATDTFFQFKYCDLNYGFQAQEGCIGFSEGLNSLVQQSRRTNVQLPSRPQIPQTVASYNGNNGIEEDRLDDLDDPTYEDVGPPIPVKKAIDKRKFIQEETKDFEALLDKVKILEVKMDKIDLKIDKMIGLVEKLSTSGTGTNIMVQPSVSPAPPSLQTTTNLPHPTSVPPPPYPPGVGQGGPPPPPPPPAVGPGGGPPPPPPPPGPPAPPPPGPPAPPPPGPSSLGSQLQGVKLNKSSSPRPAPKPAAPMSVQDEMAKLLAKRRNQQS